MNIFNGNPRLQELAMHALDWGLFRRHDVDGGLAPFIFLQKDNEISIRVLMTDGNPVGDSFSGEKRKNISGQFELNILQVADNNVDFLTFLVANAINEELESASAKSWMQETHRTVNIIVKRGDDIIYESAPPAIEPNETRGYEQFTDKQLYDEFYRITSVPNIRTNITALTQMTVLIKEYKFRGLELPATGSQLLKAYYQIRPEEMIKASPGQRILHLLTDSIASFIAAAIVYGITVDIIMPPRPISYTEHKSNSDLPDLLFFFLVYVLFTAIMEAGYKGKTPGKFLTKTRAVNLDGSPISIKTAFARAFIRAIPLNTLSALTPACNPWHDKWTNTIVIIEDL